MSISSLNEMKEWAIFIDKGVREIENFLRGNTNHVKNSEANVARSSLNGTVNDIKTTKLQLRSDICSWKKKSEELKLLLENAEAEKNKIKASLSEMNSILCPGEPFGEDNSEETSVVNGLTSRIDTLDLETDSSESFPSEEVSPCPPCNPVNESYVIIEVTPGLESKVPKSRLAAQRDFVAPPSEKKRKPFGFFGRRTLQLTYSPSNDDKDTTTVNGLLYETKIPTPLAESRQPSNLTESEQSSNTSESEQSSNLAETEQSPNGILEKPKLPVLSAYVYELLGVKYTESMEQADTPSS